MAAYFHNIGKPVPPATWQSMWDSLRNSGTITAGYGNDRGGRGYQVVSRYSPGDMIFAYANEYGLVAYGIAQGPASYRLTSYAKHGSNHRHEAGVSWRAASVDINDAMRPSDVRQFTQHLPRQTSEKIFLSVDRLIAELDRRWLRKSLSYSHLVEAFNQIEAEGYPKARESTLWDVIEPKSGHRYPPKVILNRATELAGLNKRGENYRGGGPPANDVLTGLGFTVIPKPDKELEVEQEIARIDLESLRARAERAGSAAPPRVASVGTSVGRSPWISAYAKRLAQGKCDLCRRDAPFSTKAGPFLECHHIHRLADGGPDTVENAVALCPNCHRRMHYASSGDEVAALRRRVSERVKRK